MEVYDNAPRSLWAILPAKVRYDRTLPANAKLLYAEIAAKCNEDGLCYMYNASIAEILGVSADTVSRLISTLERRGYIVVHIDNGSVNRGRRKISLTAAPYVYTPPEGGIGKNAEGGIGKNAEGGIGKNAEGVSAKMPRPIENNNLKFKPPISPKGDGVSDEQKTDTPENAPAQKPARKKRDKKQPNWKPERFDAFWRYYPPVNGERPSKGRAITAWDKLRPDDQTLEAMGRYLRAKVKSPAWMRGIGIPYAATFLNGRMWETEQVSPDSLTPASDDEEVLEEWV